MLLIVGLGNPGGKYAFNRHNAGFLVLEAIAQDHGFGPWREKFQGHLAEGQIQTSSGPKKALLLRPQTYYNESGLSVRAAAEFYKIAPEEIVVFHDEIDLAPGKFRFKTGGGHGGNNGMRSILAHVGPGVKRGRIGIGHPGQKDKVTGHVLSDFSKAEAEEWFGPMLDAITRALPLLAEGQEDAFQTKVTHLAPAPGGDAD
jgi:PTH1 family peptidyl-tRNA hydrolase